MSIGANYCVTYAEAVGTIGVLKNGTFPYTTDKELAKTDCVNYLYCDTSYLTGYTDQQLVKYQDVVASPTYTISFQARIRTSVLNNVVGFWYKYGGNDWARWTITTVVTGPSYGSVGSVIIPQGAQLYLACQNSVNTNLVFGVGNGGAYAGYCGKSASYLSQPSGNSTIYLNIDTTGAGGTLRTC